LRYEPAETEILLSREDGNPVELTRRQGAGGGEQFEGAPGNTPPSKQSPDVIKPDGSHLLARFRDAESTYSALDGFIDRTFIRYRLIPGICHLKIKIGELESNEAVVRVVEKKVDAPIANGLQLALLYGEAKGGVFDVVIRNTTDKPVIFDCGKLDTGDPTSMKIRISVNTATGTEVKGIPDLSEYSIRSGKDRFVKIAPGLSLRLCSAIPDMLTQAGGSGQTLSTGEYRIRATYTCPRDESAAAGAEGPAWTGTLTSNVLKYKYLGRVMDPENTLTD
ncbi:MAG: hypothetical protein V1809_16265, partial [Planctomycetota bacterium]